MDKHINEIIIALYLLLLIFGISLTTTGTYNNFYSVPPPRGFYSCSGDRSK